MCLGSRGLVITLFYYDRQISTDHCFRLYGGEAIPTVAPGLLVPKTNAIGGFWNYCGLFMAGCDYRTNPDALIHK